MAAVTAAAATMLAAGKKNKCYQPLCQRQHKKILMLLAPLVKRFGVSCMRDFCVIREKSVPLTNFKLDL